MNLFLSNENKVSVSANEEKASISNNGEGEINLYHNYFNGSKKLNGGQVSGIVIGSLLVWSGNYCCH